MCTVFSSVAVVVKQGRMLGKYYLQFIDDLVVSLAEAQVAFAVRFAHGRYCVLDLTFIRYMLDGDFCRVFSKSPSVCNFFPDSSLCVLAHVEREANAEHWL